MSDQPGDSFPEHYAHLTDREKQCMAAVREKFRRLYADPDVPYKLPVALTDLDGPAAGIVELPDDLDVHGLGPFNLADAHDVDTLYKLVLNHARDTVELHHLNHQVLVEIWPRLRINNRLRDTWQQHFDQLTGNRGVDTLRGPMHGLGRQYTLAENRDNLDGPTTGEVMLPTRLDHSGGHRTYDLSAPPHVETMYTTVLNEALNQEHLGYLNWDILVDIWPLLRIPNRVRDMWEAAYPELNCNPGLWGRQRR